MYILLSRLTPKAKRKRILKKGIFRIVDELYRLGTRYITILGGELLMRKDFGEIVDYMARGNIAVELIATLLNKI